MINSFKHVHDTGAYLYAADVLDGKIRVGELIRKACLRFMRDLERDDIYIDLEEARKIVNFGLLCNHWKGPAANTPIEFRPDQHFYFQQLFGWKYTETGRRRFRRSFKEISRKTGKTTELALQSLFHCLIDVKTGPQFYVGATKEDQARICLTDVGRIVEASPKLRKHFKVYWNLDQARAIKVHPTKGVMKVIGKDSKRNDGLDVSMSGIDEFHEHPDTSIRDILASAMGARLDPIESIITTAGFDIFKPCYTVSRATGVQILDGIIEDDGQLIMLFEQDDWEDWENEDNWIQSNPDIPYNDTKLTDLRSQLKKAHNEGGATEVNFKTKHLNMWVNSPETWLNHELLLSNNHGITDDDLIGRQCFAGLDLAKGIDLNAMALYFPNVRGEVGALKLYFWIPQDKIIEARKEADYQKWVDEGFVEAFPGGAVEPSRISARVIEELKKYNVKSLGYDSKYFYSGPMEYLQNAGFRDIMFNVPQGYGLSGAYRYIETLVKSKHLDLMNNPVLLWNFNNAVPMIGNNMDLKLDRSSASKKIDGVVAAAMAIHEQQRMGSAKKKKVGMVDMSNMV